MVDSFWTILFYHKPLRRCFILYQKDSRIYAGSGVLQTPKI
ncbi:olfactory receptor 4F15 [[Clostridium] clostridioforme]|nr:olfactory receptor 4F15 [Enterocloster clostridioformis]